MPRIVMFNHVTLDGCFASAEGTLDWVVPDPELDRAAVGQMSGTGAILFGRRTYQMFEGFWRNFDALSASNPHGEPSDAMRHMAKWINQASKFVISRSLHEVTWQNTRILHEIDPREITSMKEASGTDIMMFGSGSIVSQLTNLGLIDEYQFVVGPTILGNGKQLFRDVPERAKMKLIEARPHGSGNVVLRYQRAT